MGKRVRIDWEGERFASHVRASLGAAIQEGAARVQGVMKKNFGSEGGGVIGYKTRSGFVAREDRTKGTRGRQVFESSPPGSYPGVRTGTLRRSIAVEYDPASLRAKVGSSLGLQYREKGPARYGYLLEFGTSKMPARPWALRSFMGVRDRVVNRIHDRVRRDMRAYRAAAGGRAR